MNQEEVFINGELLRLRREARGWVLNDMATRACMSVKQIRQLEEGGMSAFYSVAVKATAAKKVGALLGLSADEVFAQEVPAVTVDALAESEELTAEVVTDAVSTLDAEVINTEPAELVRTQVDPFVQVSTLASDSKEDAPSSKSALWLIAILLGIAFAVGVYLQPRDEPALEPAPPIQVLPADVVDPASAASTASTAEPPASVADVVIAPASVPFALSKPAPTPVLSSSAPMVPASSSARLATSAASATATVRAASAPVVPVPAASTASKAP